MENEQMTADTDTAHCRPRVDQFFTAAEARFDRWRKLVDATRSWQAKTNGDPGQVGIVFNELKRWEEYFAYPGTVLLRTLEERIASRDIAGTARLARSINMALLNHSYRRNEVAWEGEEHAAILADRLPVSDDS